MGLWSRYFKKQVAHSTKISLGNIASALPVFIPALQYPNASLAAVLYLIVTGFGADTVHVGAHIIASILTFSSGVLGALFSGAIIVVSPNDGVLLLLACVIVIPICVSLRFGAHAKAVLLSVLTLVFFTLNLLGHRMSDRNTAAMSIVYSIISGSIAAVNSLIFNIAFQRRWATPQVQKLARRTLLAMGKTLTMISSNLVLIQPPRVADTGSERNGESEGVRESHPKRASLQFVLADIEENHLMYSRIKPPPVLVETISPATLQELWTILRTMDTYIKLIPVEQLLLDPFRQSLHVQWARVSGALGTCLVQLSAMSTLLGDGGRRYSDHTMMRFWLYAIHELLFDLSAMAATLGTLATHISSDFHTSFTPHIMLESPISTPESRKALLAHVLQGFQHYWHVVLTEEDESPGEEVRALLSAGVLWRGLGDSVYQLHVEVNALLAEAAQRKRSLKSFLENVIEWWILVALPVVTWTNQLRRISTFFTRAYWQEALQDITMIFALKQTAIIIILTIVMVLSFPLYKLLGDPYGAWIIVSLLVVMQLSVESTVQRLIFRTIGTATGCALAYAVMYDTATSTRQEILCAFLFVVVWVASLFLYTPVRYSIFVFCISADIVVLGQFGKESSYTFALSRGVSVVIGATIAFVASLIFPYYAARSVAGSLKKIINDGSTLSLFFVERYISFGLHPDDNDPSNHQAMQLIDDALPPQILTNDVIASAPTSLMTHVIGALSAIDGKIEKETAAWRVGPFSVPRRVFAAMQQLRVISNRLAAFQTALRRAPVLRGTYGEQGSQPHRIFILPLMPHIDTLMQAQQALMSSLGEYVVERHSVPIPTIVDLARAFQTARQGLIAGLAAARANMYVEARHHGDVSAHPEELPLLPDDTVLFCGFFFSWMSVCNAIADLTRTMLPSNIDLSFLSNRQLSSTGLILSSEISPPPAGNNHDKRTLTRYKAGLHVRREPGSSSTEEEVELRRRSSDGSVTSIESRNSTTVISNPMVECNVPHVGAALAERPWLPEHQLESLFSPNSKAHQDTDSLPPPLPLPVADLKRASLLDAGWTEPDPDATAAHERLVRDDLALRLELHCVEGVHSSAYAHQVAAEGVGVSVRDRLSAATAPDSLDTDSDDDDNIMRGSGGGGGGGVDVRAALPRAKRDQHWRESLV